MIVGVGNIDAAERINCDAVGQLQRCGGRHAVVAIESTQAIAGERRQQAARDREFSNTMIIAVCDDDVVAAINDDVPGSVDLCGNSCPVFTAMPVPVPTTVEIRPVAVVTLRTRELSVSAM